MPPKDDVLLTDDRLSAGVLRAISKALPRKQVFLDSRFEDLGIESLDAMSLIFAVEEEFDIDLDAVPSGEIKSVEDVVRAVRTVLHSRMSTST